MTELPDVQDPAQRADAVARAQARSAHPDVLGHLAAANRSDAQQRSLDALASGVAVVTGQQTGLFGGPLYTLHKAVAAIANARALEAQTGVPCAPVFWVQDEDHDVDEIRSATLLASDGSLLRASVEADPSRAGCRVADQVLGPSIEAALDVLTDALGGLPHAGEVEAMHRDSHHADATFPQAFTAVLQQLFADHGLLFLDAAAPELQPAAASVHARAIDQASPIADALLARADVLSSRGDRVPVHIRPGSPLSFVHPDRIDGPRFRAHRGQSGRGRGAPWSLVGTDRTLTDAELRSAPHSTSALLRPILQDSWLPTAAYVGGPGELAYLAQLPPLWPLFDLPVPLIAHRAHFRLIDGPAAKLLGQLGLDASAACATRDEVLVALGSAAEGHTDPKAVADAVRRGLDELVAFADEADTMDPNLGKSVRKTIASLEHKAQQLSDRYRRTLAREDHVTSDRLDRLRAQLCPDDAPQERVLAWPTFGARIGPAPLVQRLLDAARPFDPILVDVML